MKDDALRDIIAQGLPLPSEQPPPNVDQLAIEDCELSIDPLKIERQTATLAFGPRGQQLRVLHRELLLVHGVAQRDCHVDDRSASPRRPIRTRFAAVRTRMRSLGAYLGSRGARMGRKVAVW